ncbi:hypothetical protein Z310_01103 [Streptococcus pyogenes ABC020006103]|nr:hypothetical protein Z492_01103 [Streptococcus pyogenes ABC020052558]EZL14894.1 hypothetical protein Z388_01039 [Streptococcus pyogenes ABC020052420]EZL69345.1 hypothetical protein Z310_01103 [Streptococcus pyogenes ABC020006103]
MKIGLRTPSLKKNPLKLGQQVKLRDHLKSLLIQCMIKKALV